MLAALPAQPLFEEISTDEARKLLENEGFQSSVGHVDTAKIFADLLGLEVLVVRSTVSLEKGQTALVGQYCGPRLPEGTTILPEGSTIKWVKVTL